MAYLHGLPEEKKNYNCWKAHFYLNNTNSQEDRTETFGFKSRYHPGQREELEEFEQDLLNMVKSIKFKHSTDPFQNKLKTDISGINESPNVFVFADKTNNVYEMSPESHDKLSMENITKTYKKAPERLEIAINLEAKAIAEKLNLANRIENLARTPSYITLKDHKENFRANPSCRLINPCKNELGKVSKSILERINGEIVECLEFNQWKNTNQVIQWFDDIPVKSECTFIQLDIKEFYPSISEKTLDEAISFARNHVNVTDEEVRIIKHCRKSLLFKNDEPWKKKTTDSMFDVTMGSYDGAEVCELTGSYILSILASKIPKNNMGLYRDDGLILLRKANGRSTDKSRKDIIKIFKDVGFQIDINTNLPEVDFLDVTFNLQSNTYRPYKKPNEHLIYINTSSNHPPNIIKQLPESISERLSRNSSNQAIFDETKREYEEALQKCGYKTKLTYKPPKTENEKNKRRRKRNIIWFNPPFSKTVSTNVARTFLRLIDKHFPANNRLHKIFNRNTVKVSYSCTGNISKIIKNHNKKVTSENPEEDQGCKCRNKSICPLDGKCRSTDVVYKCIVSSEYTPDRVYIGLAGGEWITRYRNHVKSFKHKKYAKETTLSKYVWKLKEQGKEPSYTWSIVKSVPKYSNQTKRCPLCLYEKLTIITYENQDELLNKRTEMISKCRHENKFNIYIRTFIYVCIYIYTHIHTDKIYTVDREIIYIPHYHSK